MTPHSIDSSQFFQTPSKNPRNDDEAFKDEYRRDKTDLDIASFYSSMDASKAKAEDNLKDYIKNFSIHLSLPTVYVRLPSQDLPSVARLQHLPREIHLQ